MFDFFLEDNRVQKKKKKSHNIDLFFCTPSTALQNINLLKLIIVINRTEYWNEN